TTPSSLREWSYQVSSTAQAPYVSYSYSSSAPTAIGGSLEISSTSSANVTATVSKSFHYPFRGPPGIFQVDIKGDRFTAKVDGISSSQQVSLKVFIDKGDKRWTLWSVNVTQMQTGTWLSPNYPLSSNDYAFDTVMGIRGGLSAAETIFPTAADYSYGLEATFQGPATVHVTGLGLTLLGTSYGLMGTDNFGTDLFAQVIEAARAAGAGTRRILTSHVFPNIVSLTYVNLALSVPAAILTEAALSFLGLGDPISPSWGQILHNAQSFGNLDKWWWVVPPGISIALISLSFVLIGYALDELSNPKLSSRRVFQLVHP